MRVVLTVEHPAWAHQFRHVVRLLQARGHIVKVAAIDKDGSTHLLSAFGIDHATVGASRGERGFKKAWLFLTASLRLVHLCARWKPDVFVGRGTPLLALCSALFRRPYLVFDDTERGGIALWCAQLCAAEIVTPRWFRRELGAKQVRVDTFKEAFYLHPRWFVERPEVRDKLGLSERRQYAVVRFVSWTAMHDARQCGFADDSQRISIVRALSDRCKVIVSAEGPLPEELECFRAGFPAEDMHDVLKGASLVVAEGGTMAAEAALLGTPCIRVSSRSSAAGNPGNFVQLEDVEGLLFSFRSPEAALAKALELLDCPQCKSDWETRASRLMDRLVDGPSLIVQMAERLGGAGDSDNVGCAGRNVVDCVCDRKKETTPGCG